MTRSPGRVAGQRAGRRAHDPELLLERYRLESRIGEGATSTVWRARDERLDRPVAVKILHPEIVADATARTRLAREARSVARLSHPNVVGVHDVVVSRGLAAVVLEYVPGISLLERMRSGHPIEPDEAVRIGSAIASALAAAHALGMVHRDVKPANILLGDDGRPRLADFGIALALEGARADVTEADGVAGTLRYLAPERLQGGPPSPAADVWSLGIVIHEMLTGRSPVAGRGPIELLDAELAGPPRSSDEPAIEGAVRAALAADPAARPSAAELAARLDAAALPLADRRASQAPPGAVASAVAGPGALAVLPAAGWSPEESTVTAIRPATAIGTAAPAARPWRSGALRSRPRAIAIRRSWPRVRRAAGPLAALAGVLVVALLLMVPVGFDGTTSPGVGNARASEPPVAVASLVPTPTPIASPSAALPANAPAPAPRHARGKGHGHGGEGG